MPRYILRSEEKERYGDSRRMLRALLEEGLRTKVSEMRRDDYRKRLEEEVYVIESTNNVDYFLIQWDMVAEAAGGGSLRVWAGDLPGDRWSRTCWVSRRSTRWLTICCFPVFWCRSGAG